MVAETRARRPAKAGYNHAKAASRGRPIPRTLRDLRVARGLSIRALEDASGVNRAIISQIERGRLVATPEEARKLGDALSLPGPLVTRTMLVHEEASA